MSPIIEDRINNWWPSRAVCFCPSTPPLTHDPKVQQAHGAAPLLGHRWSLLPPPAPSPKQLCDVVSLTDQHDMQPWARTTHARCCRCKPAPAPHSLPGAPQGCHSGLGPGKHGCHWLYASAHPDAGITHRASGVAPHGGSGACHQGWCPAVPCVCQYPGRMSQTHANCREVCQLHPKGHPCYTQFMSILTQCQGVKHHAHTPGALALSGNSPPVGVPNPRSYPSRTPGIPQQAGVLPPPPLCFGAATASTTPLQCIHSSPMAPLLAAPLGKQQHNCPLGWGLLGKPFGMPHNKPPQGCPLATSSSLPTIAAPPPPQQARVTVPLPATLVALPPPPCCPGVLLVALVGAMPTHHHWPTQAEPAGSCSGGPMLLASGNPHSHPANATRYAHAWLHLP